MAKKVAPHGFMIEPGQFKALRKLAFEKEITISALVRAVLDQYLNDLKKQIKGGK